MDLYELELERRLARREPPRGFSERVMAQVRQEARPGSAGVAAAGWRVGGWLSGWGLGGRKAWSWGLTGALAATLAVGALVQNRRIVERRAAEQALAEQAEAELVDALFVTGTTIHRARERAGAPKGLRAMRLATLGLAVFVSAPVWGLTGAKVDVDLPHLKERADEVVEVNLEGKSLEDGSRLLAIRQGVSPSMKSVLNGLKGIYRRTYRFGLGGDSQFVEDDLAPIRQKMTGAGWSPMLDVRDKSTRESVTVYSYMEGESVAGVTVVSSDPNEVTVVNIVGAVDLDALLELSEEMGLSSMKIATTELEKQKLELPKPSVGPAR